MRVGEASLCRGLGYRRVLIQTAYPTNRITLIRQSSQKTFRRRNRLARTLQVLWTGEIPEGTNFGPSTCIFEN